MSLSAAAGSVTAPVAPGRLGVEVQPSQALAYLEQLGRWRDGRQAELDQLDQAALGGEARGLRAFARARRSEQDEDDQRRFPLSLDFLMSPSY